MSPPSTRSSLMIGFIIFQSPRILLTSLYNLLLACDHRRRKKRVIEFDIPSTLRRLTPMETFVGLFAMYCNCCYAIHRQSQSRAVYTALYEMIASSHSISNSRSGRTGFYRIISVMYICDAVSYFSFELCILYLLGLLGHLFPFLFSLLLLSSPTIRPSDRYD